VDGSVSPDTWARRAIAAYHDHKAGWIAAEKNFGGAMVKHTIMTVDPNVPVREVNATRGKAVRAEPVSALYEQGRALHVRPFPELEMQMCQWVPGPNSKSPDRLDGMVWALASLNVSVPTDLMKQVVFV
jgi:phage terminase large subunit-like protein